MGTEDDEGALMLLLPAAHPAVLMCCMSRTLARSLALAPTCPTLLLLHCQPLHLADHLPALIVAARCSSPAQVRSIPVYFAWIPRISYFSFATDAAAANEFDGLIFTGGEAGPEGVPGLSLLPPAMRTGLSVGGNLGVLLGITAGCRLLCLGLLEAAARLKFL